MTETTSAGEMSDDQIGYVREYLTDCICDDMDDAIDFLSMRDDIEMAVSERVHSMSGSEVVEFVEQYSECPIEDVLTFD